MLTLESLSLDKYISVFLAIRFAEKAFPIWEKEYPENMRPRKAIERAKGWLESPTAAWASPNARSAAVMAASAAKMATHNGKLKAASAARSAANAGYTAAYESAWADANSAYAAAAAAVAAAKALEINKEALIHKVILKNIGWILQYKLKSKQTFAQPELIFDWLEEGQVQDFLFNLDAVA